MEKRKEPETRKREKGEREDVSTFKEWVGKKNVEIIYDSDVDEFTWKMFNSKCLHQPNIAIISFTQDGDVFGGYFNIAVNETWEWLKDPNHFIFSFESHGRCQTPQRFMMKEER